MTYICICVNTNNNKNNSNYKDPERGLRWFHQQQYNMFSFEISLLKSPYVKLMQYIIWTICAALYINNFKIKKNIEKD